MRWGPLALGFAVAACGGTGKGEPDLARIAALQPPAEHQVGAILFATSCSPCHGTNATGTTQGPPLVHDYYRPGHHADAAFLVAVQRGVIAHHWRFGNMPPVPGMTSKDVADVTAFVRWLQRQAGID